MLILCIALHVYAGPIASDTAVTVLANECKKANVARVRREVAKCASQGAETCEVIVGNGRVTIENKIQVAKVSK